MFLKSIAGATLAAFVCLPALADDSPITIEDAFARSGPHSGAAFFVIHNNGDTDDRLVAARSDVAARVELHTHIEDENGVMKMREVEDGFAVPANGMHMLKRGGDHVMFMGLETPFEDGETISVTLTFEAAGDIDVEIPVDNERQGSHGHGYGN